MRQPDRLSRILRLWGKSGFYLFVGGALVLAGITLVEGQFTLRALLVICAAASLGLVSLGLTRVYEWIADKLFSKD